MSIWSSEGDDVAAGDQHGGDRVLVDVATATSWNGQLRLALIGDATDVCLLLELGAAETLHRNLGAAIARVRATLVGE